MGMGDGGETRLKEKQEDAAQGEARTSKEGRGEETEEKEGSKCAKTTDERLFPLHEREQADGEEGEPGCEHRRGGKILGKMWGEIEPADKAKFDKEAAAAKKKWEAEKAAYAKKGKAAAPAAESGDEEDEEEEADDSE